MKSDDTGMPDYLSDCRLMLRFARRNGLDIPRRLQHDIATLDTMLCRLNAAPISELPTSLIQAAPTSVEPPAMPLAIPAVATEGPATSTVSLEMTSIAPVEAVIYVHGELSKVIAPASALSLQTSEPPPGRHRFLGGMPLVVKAAAITALLSAVGFVVSAGFIAGKKSTDRAIVASERTPEALPAPAPVDEPEKPR